MTSRNSSLKSPSRRPKLMRASATCPQLAMSNASRKDLASLQSCSATTILTHVASYSSAQHDHALRTSPLSTCSSPGQMGEERRKEPLEIVISQSGNYFSFPSFEDFEEWKQEEDRREGREERDVP